MNSGVAATPLRRAQAALPYLIVLAAGIFLYVAADRFEFEQVSGRIGPGAWPKLILALMLITALWGIVAAWRGGETATADAAATTDTTEDLVRPPEIYPHRVWLAVVATLGYLLILPLLGFFLATIIYSFVLMYLGEFRRLVTAALLSVGISLFFVFMFMRVVYVALPAGVAPFDAVSYALMAAIGVH